MLALFELAKLCDFVSSRDKKENLVSQFAFKAVGNKNYCALYFSNGTLSLWQFDSSGRPPLVSAVPWDVTHPITSMSFDPSATWLLCSSLDSIIYIVPFANLLIPDCTLVGPWKTHNVTKIKMFHKHGITTYLCWWQTFSGRHVAIVGTKLGFLLFIDLISGKLLTETDVNEQIYSIYLIQDDSQSFTYALITTRSNLQWKQLLEQRHETPGSIQHAENLGYDVLTSVHPKVSSVFNATESTECDFLPLRFYQFASNVNLTQQYAKGHHFVAAHDVKTTLLKVYESSLQHTAVYVYHLPETCDSILFCDRLSFLTSSNDRANSILIWSNQLAEASEDPNKGDAMIQDFTFPCHETILSVTKQSYPLNWHSEQEKGSDPQQTAHGSRGIDGIDIPHHTVLDGCLVLTTRGLYSCRPRISPERYFLHLACAPATYKLADKVGIIVGLDVHMMYQKAAQYCLTQSKCALALSLFKLGKCPHKDRIRLLILSGRINEATSCLRQLLSTRHTRSSSVDITKPQRRALSNLALYCFLYELLQCEDTARRQKYEENLREFLEQTYTFDKQRALELLAEHKQLNLLHDFVLGRGMVQAALEMLLDEDNSSNTRWAVKEGEQRLVRTHTPNIGALWPLLGVVDFKDLLENEETTNILLRHLGAELASLPRDALICVADLLQPSSDWLKTSWSEPQPDSPSSLPSDPASLVAQWQTMGASSIPVHHFTRLFVEAVVLLHQHRMKHTACTDVMQELLLKLARTERTAGEEKEGKPPAVRRELRHQPHQVACGFAHAAAVVGGECFTWGHATRGRLGHGDSSLVNEHRPLRLEGLPAMTLRVTSVACGAEHCVALTDKGVFGWGSSSLGQVGAGTRQCYTLPVAITELQQQRVTMVTCGQYHSMALTTDSRVYTWGWGVHGQLGQGDIEDRLVPHLVQQLDGASVVSLAAGHSHSMALTQMGEVWVFGCGMFGQTGLGTTQKRKIPCKLKIGAGIRSIATKFFHSLAVGTNNVVYTWGLSPEMLRLHVSMMKRSQQQPNRIHAYMADNYHHPTRVNTSGVKGHIVQGVCGLNMSGLLTSDGSVYTWGSNAEGQLGLTNTSLTDASLTIPKNVATAARIITLAMGKDFVVAMDSKETLWGWGSSDCGQLGRETSGSGDEDSPSALLHIMHQQCDTVYKPAKITVPASRNIRNKITKMKANELVQQGAEWCFEDVGAVTIPELRGSGMYPYSASTIQSLLQCVPSLTESQYVLEVCKKHEAWVMAVHIAHYTGHYTELMDYLAKYLLTQNLNTSDFSGFIFKCVDVLMKSIQEECGTHSGSLSGKDELLQKMMDVCIQAKVPVQKVEDYLESRFQEFSSLVFLIMRSCQREGLQYNFSSKFQMTFTQFLIDTKQCNNLTTDMLPSQGSAMASQGSAMPSQGRAMASQSSVMPSQGRAMPSQGSVMPSQGRAMPSQGSAMASQGSAMPSQSSAMASQGSAMASQGSAMPSQSSVMPSQGRAMPSQGRVMPTSSPTESPILPDLRNNKPGTASILLDSSDVAALTRLQVNVDGVNRDNGKCANADVEVLLYSCGHHSPSIPHDQDVSDNMSKQLAKHLPLSYLTASWLIGSLLSSAELPFPCPSCTCQSLDNLNTT